MQYQRGFAGAVRSEKRNPLAAVDREVDAKQRLESIGIGERETIYIERGVGQSGTQRGRGAGWTGPPLELVHDINQAAVQTAAAANGSDRVMTHSDAEARPSLNSGIAPL